MACATENSKAFEKLRAPLMLHYQMRDMAVVKFGQEDTIRIMEEIIQRLRARFGDSLGRLLA